MGWCSLFANVALLFGHGRDAAEPKGARRRLGTAAGANQDEGHGPTGAEGRPQRLGRASLGRTDGEASRTARRPVDWAPQGRGTRHEVAVAVSEYYDCVSTMMEELQGTQGDLVALKL